MSRKESLISIDDSKKSTKTTKHCTSENFCIVGNVCKIFFFFFTNLSQGNFLYWLRTFIRTKNLNTARTPTEMKQNLLH